jgi:hypothetical protein
MNAIASSISSFFTGSTQDLTGFLLALAVIGTATMALIQAVKDVTPMRNWYQRWRLRRWLAEGIDEARERHASLVAKSNGAPSTSGPADSLNLDDVEADLVRLAVDGDRDALYDLAIEQLCGQVNAGLQLVIDYPTAHRALLLVAGSQANTEDLTVLLEADRTQFDPRNDDPEQVRARQEFADARNQVSHQLQRAVDGFQIAASYRWKWILQLLSFAVSAILAAAALSLGSPAAQYRTATVVFTAILAGFLAPVARDLTAAIQKLRT